MANAISFKFNGREFFARELTARQIDQVLGGPARRLVKPDPSPTAAIDPSDLAASDLPPGHPDQERETGGRPVPFTAPAGFHIFDLLFHDEPVSSLAATLSTGISLDELNGDISPVELETVMVAVKEANPFLVRAVNNGVRMAGEFEERLKRILASRSAVPPTSSSSTATTAPGTTR